MPQPPARPAPSVVVMHWLVAVGVLGMLAFGYWISGLPRGQLKTDYVQLHKSFGVIVFACAVARILWRMRVGFPAPRGAASERRFAILAHWLLLALTIAAPLSGIVRSISYARPVSLFGLPLLPQLLAEKNEPLNDLAGSVHDACALLLVVLIALHLAGAAKHHFIDRDDTLSRMIPTGRRPLPERGP